MRRIYRRLIAAALLLWLVLAGLLLATTGGTREHRADPLTDEQTKAQVVESATQIAVVARLQRPSGGYTLLSCTSADEPPYQGVVFVYFRLPSDALTYFGTITTALIGNGWVEGTPPNPPGKTLRKDGVTAVINRNRDDPGGGIVKLYGECRNFGDHRRDTKVWVDITEQLTGAS